MLFRKTIAVTALAIVFSTPFAVSSAGAAPNEKYPTLIVRDLPAQVRLVPGEKVKIVLETNRTTGYSWQAEGGCCTADDKTIARVSKGRYVAPENTNGMVGVPGNTTWTVTAVRPGTTEIVITTRPPGSTNTMDDQEVGQLKVIVSPR